MLALSTWLTSPRTRALPISLLILSLLFLSTQFLINNCTNKVKLVNSYPKQFYTEKCFWSFVLRNVSETFSPLFCLHTSLFSCAVFLICKSWSSNFGRPNRIAANMLAIGKIQAIFSKTLTPSMSLLSARRSLSDALFVHRETDENVKSFEFDEANKKVCFELQSIVLYYNIYIFFRELKLFFKTILKNTEAQVWFPCWIWLNVNMASKRLPQLFWF